MAFNGSGTFVRVHDWTTDLANTVPVTASRMDDEMDGMATGLSTALCKDGQQTATARIPFAVGVSSMTGSTSSASYAHIGDLNTGLYFPAADQWGLTAGGTVLLVGSLTDGGTVSLAGILQTTGRISSASPTSGIGYQSGAGGTVTQLTSKSTGVTLNTVTGAITMHNATLNAGDEVTFTLTNSAIAQPDVIIVHRSATGTAGAYIVQCSQVSAGSCAITVSNVSASNLSEAIVLSFAVIKGATS